MIVEAPGKTIIMNTTSVNSLPRIIYTDGRDHPSILGIACEDRFKAEFEKRTWKKD